jgi:zinc transporter
MSTGLLHALLFDGTGGARALDGWAALDAWSPNDGVVWINLDYSVPEAAAWLEKSSHIDPLVLAALLDPDPRPRAVAHNEDLLMITRGINNNAGAAPEDMISVRCYVEARRIVTLRHRVSRSLEAIAADLGRGRGPKTAGDFAATFVERTVEHVVTRVDVLGEDVAACEDQALAESRGTNLRTVLADHRRHAIQLRRFLAPQREALGKLATINLPWLDAMHRARIVEVADRMTRTVEELDAARDRAAVTQEELDSQLASATNRRLYVLSLVSVVFLPLGFVCGLLGVNVGGVPFTHDDWAFWALCAVFAVAVITALWIFRRRGWL